MKVFDLNTPGNESVFDATSVFQPGDTRSYIYWLKAANEYHKIDNLQDIVLGNLEI